MKLALLSVNVSLPKPLAQVDDQIVMSAIGKGPVTTREIRVLWETLEGDAVADRAVHGGADKAVYAYPADNWPWWRTEHALACKPGAFGENLTVEGADESGVRIGDQFSWGDALLEVSQPRQPCFKFQLHTGRPDAAALMTIHARCGWYFRVIREGIAPVAGILKRTHASDGPSVREAFIAAMHRRTGEEDRKRIAAHPALARSFRATLLRQA
jgi:MOSC domain-containing protein YiiM